MTTITIDRSAVEKWLEHFPRNDKAGDAMHAALTAEKMFRAALAATSERKPMVTPYITQEQFGRVFPAATSNPSRPSGPAWRDVPTEPGLWMASSSNLARQIDEYDIAHFAQYNDPRRWFGPIPPDGDTK